MARKKLNQFLNAIHTPNWVALLLLGLFLLRIPSFFEPFNYGDEMIYLTLGQGINKGLVLYKDIHDNKPPLLYLTAAVAGNVFWFRVILAFWMMATTIIFWKLTDRLFPKNTKLVKAATIFFGIFTTIPLLEGQTANAELFLIGPVIAAFYLVVNKKAKLWHYAFSGLLFSIATLFKVPAAFDGLALIFVLFILSKNKLNKKDFFQKSLLVLFGFITPIFVSFVWYWLRGALNEYLVAAYLQNVGYLSSWRPGDATEPFIVRNAPLLARGVVMFAGYAILYLYRKKLSLPFLLGSAWLLSSLFAITLSERPYPHYLVQAIPAISLLFGMLLFKKDIEQTFTIIPLFLALLVPVYYNFWHYPTLPYYTRFINFATGAINKEEYFNRFEGNVNRNYEIAKFLRESSAPHDRVFVWGDAASTIYALSRRLPPIKYVATYHINDFASKEEIITAIDSQKPAYVIVLSEAEHFNELNSYLNLNYMQIKTIDDAVIWRLINPRVLSIIR